MSFKNFGLIITAFVVSLAFTPAAFACGPEDDQTGCDGGETDPEPPAKTKGNNGLGNGDQAAPGNSLANNKAENQVGAPGHASGKAQVENQ